MAERDDITGVILAGGRAQRLGGIDKGLFEFAGAPLVRHAIDLLAPQVARVLINANRNADRYAAFGHEVIADPAEFAGTFAGPLAGFLAALRSARTDWVATAPCDAPYLPADLVARLDAGRGAARAAVVRTGAYLQPVCCLLHVGLAAQLDAALRSGTRKAEQWLLEIGAAEVTFDDEAAFANLNTHDDIAKESGGCSRR